jgi:hypothetical protein
VRIDRFGDDYNTAYQFPQNMMEDQFAITRPAIAARVSGKSGAFDYYGDAGFPFAPFTLKKRFVLQADGDHAAIEALIDALRAATIEQDTESKLWLLWRYDYNEVHANLGWAWAKCTALRVPDNWRSYYALTVEVEFFCREGQLYKERAIPA